MPAILVMILIAALPSGKLQRAPSSAPASNRQLAPASQPPASSAARIDEWISVGGWKLQNNGHRWSNWISPVASSWRQETTEGRSIRLRILSGNYGEPPERTSWDPEKPLKAMSLKVTINIINELGHTARVPRLVLLDSEANIYEADGDNDRATEAVELRLNPKTPTGVSEVFRVLPNQSYRLTLKGHEAKGPYIEVPEAPREIKRTPVKLHPYSRIPRMNNRSR